MALSGEAGSIESWLSGGHPNSLGETEAVTAWVLEDRGRLGVLLDVYGSSDEVVRLRVSSALKRVCIARPEWVHGSIARVFGEVAEVDQPSARWTVAKLFLMLWELMSGTERERAVGVVKRNLVDEPDWIVQNNSIEALAEWAREDPDLKEWLLPELQLRMGDDRRSVARRASKALASLAG